MRSDVKELIKAVRPYTKAPISELNTTVIMHDLIIDLCENSSIKNGICLSQRNLGLMNALKQFNYKRIYNHWKIENYKKYAELVISSIYDMLKRFYRKEKTCNEIQRYSEVYPILCGLFLEWLKKYSDSDIREKFYQNKTLYNLQNEQDYIKAIVDFIAGMTDSFAIKLFNEIIMF